MRTLSYPFLSSPLLSVLALFHAMNLVACQAASTSSSAACTSSSISADCAAQSGKTLTLTSRRPLAIKAGAKVALKGTGFSEAMTATVGGIPATSLRVSSATSASLVAPAGVTPGMADLKLSLSGSQVTASMAYMPTGDIPLITLAVSEVCSGVEYYDINGDRQTGTKSCSSSSSSSPNPWDVRAGVTVGGVTGKLKVNCRNRINSGIHNHDGLIGGISTNGFSNGGTELDIWDTIDDYNYTGFGIPSEIVTAWGSNTDCGGVEASAGDDNVWRDVTTTSLGAASTCTADIARCTMQDKITGLRWSKIQATSQAWNTAWATCAGLNHNGQTGWRLPTQKELMDGYSHGIKSAASTEWIAESAMIMDYFWSGSTSSNNAAAAWFAHIGDGSAGPNNKSAPSQVVCVR